MRLGWIGRLGVVVGFALTVGACEQTANFTPAPLPGYLEPQTDAQRTVIFAAVPLDIDTLRLTIAQQRSGTPTKIVTWLRRGGCITESGRPRCFGARIDGQITTLDGIALDVTGDDQLNLRVPVKLELVGRGLRQARNVRDTSTTEAFITLAFAFDFGEDLRPVVRLIGEPTIEGGEVALLGTTVDLSRWLEARVGPIETTTTAALSNALARAELANGTRMVWQRLQQPIALGGLQKRWLKGMPQRVASAGFAKTEFGIAARAAIEADLSVLERVGADEAFLKPLKPEYIVGFESSEARAGGARRSARKARVSARPVVNQDGEDVAPIAADLQAAKLEMEGATENGPIATQSGLRLAFAVPIDFLQRGVAKAFPPGDVISARHDAVSPEFMFRLGETRVFAAQRFLGLSIQAELQAPVRLAGRSGDINLVGRLTVDPLSGELALVGVSFPVISSTTAREVDPQMDFSAAPFAARLKQHLKLDLGPQLTAFRADLHQMFSQRVEIDLTLESDLAVHRYLTAIPSKTGLDIRADVRGDLTLVYRAGIQRTAARVEDTAKAGGRYGPSLVQQIRALSKQ